MPDEFPVGQWTTGEGKLMAEAVAVGVARRQEEGEEPPATPTHVAIVMLVQIVPGVMTEVVSEMAVLEAVEFVDGMATCIKAVLDGELPKIDDPSP